ncbi:MAG: hypothetical protein JO189_32795 [Deltaproteobacteria bacterium]|nr:hypothetical protein [Deltaproteobacteria bacterium]
MHLQDRRRIGGGGPGTCAFMPRNVPHAWKNTGSGTSRVLFLYTPAAAGGLIEALAERRPADAGEYQKPSSATAGRSSDRGSERKHIDFFGPLQGSFGNAVRP